MNAALPDEPEEMIDMDEVEENLEASDERKGDRQAQAPGQESAANPNIINK